MGRGSLGLGGTAVWGEGMQGPGVQDGNLKNPHALKLGGKSSDCLDSKTTNAGKKLLL